MEIETESIEIETKFMHENPEKKKKTQKLYFADIENAQPSTL